LINNNPSFLQAVAKKNAAAFSIKSAYANFSPEIYGDAGAGKRGSSWPAQNDQWNLGLTLTMPLFEGGLKTAQVNQARALYNQRIADEKTTKDTALVLLEQTWAALQDSIEIVDVRQKLLNAANERSKIAEAQYSTGFITFDNWIIIENDLVSAKKAYLNSQADALFAEAGWIQAKGETLEYAQ
jgi:outer membrane protein TolC